MTYMVLDAHLNGLPSGLLLTVVRDPDGHFQAYAGELRGLRIKLDEATPDDRLLALDQISGLHAHYDEQHQSIDLRADDSRLAPYVVGLGGQRQLTDLSQLQSTPGAIFNYGLNNVTGSYLPSRTTGNLEVIAMLPTSNLATTWLYDSAHGFGTEDDRYTLRLDSTWRKVDPAQVRTYAVGDINTGALDWSRSIRLAGLQVQSAFQQRPDLVTWAMPQFAGSAALPSTLDLYVNNMKVFTGEIPAGPFDLQALPFINAGEVRIVTTDINGLQHEVTQPYYSAPGLLRQGLSEYSLDFGAPRRNYGISSSQYDDILAGSTALRHGLTDHLTLEGNTQATDDGLKLLGLGMSQAVGPYAVLALATTASRYRGWDGKSGTIDLDARLWGVRAYASLERSSQNFYDLARVALYRERTRRENQAETLADNWLDLTANASAIDRAGLSFQPWFDPPTTINLGYTRLETPSDSVRLINLSLSRRIGRNASAYINGFWDPQHPADHGIYASVSFNLGERSRATFSSERNRGASSLGQQLSGNTGSGQGNLDWMLANREYSQGTYWRTANLGYQASFADLHVQTDQSNDSQRTLAQVSGSVVVAADDVFLANRVGDAFAIVRNAGPGSEIRQNGARITTADSQGSALLAQVRPYSNTRIDIDPIDLPLDWVPQTTQRTVVAAWRQGAVADFGVRPAHGALLTLVDTAGQPLPLGYQAFLDGHESGSPIGHDGEVYLTGLEPENHLIVKKNRTQVCRVAFPYQADGSSLSHIGPLTCR